LKDKGYVDVTAGRSGGISLALEPNRIRLGDVVRQVETNLQIVECFDPKTNTCPIVAACQLNPILAEALNAFLQTLNKYTLADLLDPRRRNSLARLFALTSASKLN
jgi:Rrf2 family nitric oxide-sensitive transcriptional repressor